MFRLKTLTIMIIGVALLSPSFCRAMTDELWEVYAERPDLQAAFEAESGQAVTGSAAGFLIDLEDWARQYGWQDYSELADYRPAISPVAGNGVPAPEVSATHYVVIDNESGAILAAQGAEVEWPIASITKLTTTKIALEHGLDPYAIGSVEDVDDVGGAKLWVTGGTTFQVLDLLEATIIASANNAANAIARLSGLTSTDFIAQMNAYAEELNLSHTRFADPTGIELGNVSTAREIAYLASQVFAHENIRKLAGTWRMHIESISDPDYVRDIYSTDWMLYDSAYDGVYVTAGKTGYLDESGWNLVVRMHPMGDVEAKSVLVVIFGAGSRRESCDAALALAEWAWDNFNWSGRE